MNTCTLKVHDNSTLQILEVDEVGEPVRVSVWTRDCGAPAEDKYCVDHAPLVAEDAA